MVWKAEIFRAMIQFPSTFKISHIISFRKQCIKYWFGADGDDDGKSYSFGKL